MDTIEQHLNKAVYFVRATSNEVSNLWSEWNGDIPWQQVKIGTTIPVGNIDDNPSYPVHVSFSFCYLFGQCVCFYDPIGRYVDHILVDTYIKEEIAQYTFEDNFSNAMNFHNVVKYCRSLNPQVASYKELSSHIGEDMYIKLSNNLYPTSIRGVLTSLNTTSGIVSHKGVNAKFNISEVEYFITLYNFK